MTIYYRGAGAGTYWHTNDAPQQGFIPQSPGGTPPRDRLINHIARGTVTSPYVSLTQSYGVAWSYAVFFGLIQPNQQTPAYVYNAAITFLRADVSEEYRLPFALIRYALYGEEQQVEKYSYPYPNKNTDGIKCETCGEQALEHPLKQPALPQVILVEETQLLLERNHFSQV